jgi:hypothetical protein
MSRVACKFLVPEATAPFTRFRWPTSGAWVEASGRLEPCLRGIHGVEREHLARWLQPELWQIELDGEVLDAGTKVLAERGRLAARVQEWNADTAREFMEHCVKRGRELASEHPGSELLEGFAEQAAGYLDGTFEPDDPFQAAATGSYVVARAVGAAASMEDADAHEAGFDTERRRQSLWLAERLGL